MGCEFIFFRLHAKSVDEAKTEVLALIGQARHDHGHAGYSGTLAEAQGVHVPKQPPFTDVTEAMEWVEDNAEKWGAAEIVATAGGNYYVGAMCSS